MLKKRWVLKIGNSLAGDGKILDELILARLAAEIAELQQLGVDIVLVSSGAITEGVNRLGWSQRPSDMPRLQAAAAVGQSALTSSYEKAFRQNGLRCAQFLLTREEFSNPQRRFNLRASLRKLIDLKTVPVVNENQAVSTYRTQLDGRDMLAMRIAKMIHADRLVILTNKKSPWTKNLNRQSSPEVFRNSSQEKNESGKLERLDSFGLNELAGKVKAVESFAAYGGAATIATWQGDPVLRKIFLDEL